MRGFHTAIRVWNNQKALGKHRTLLLVKLKLMPAAFP
jgi:hypothetical protein